MKAYVKSAILGSIRGIRDLLAHAEAVVASEETPEPGVFMIQSWPGHDIQVDGCPLGMHATYAQADEIGKAIASHRPKTDRMGYARDRSREKKDA